MLISECETEAAAYSSSAVLKRFSNTFQLVFSLLEPKLRIRF